MNKDNILESLIMDEKETLVNSAFDVFNEYTKEVQSYVDETPLQELSWAFVN